MLGPGTTITHSAVHTLAESGCTIAWVGESGARLYATGLGETRSARHLMHQARRSSATQAPYACSENGGYLSVTSMKA